MHTRIALNRQEMLGPCLARHQAMAYVSIHKRTDCRHMDPCALSLGTATVLNSSRLSIASILMLQEILGLYGSMPQQSDLSCYSSHNAILINGINFYSLFLVLFLILTFHCKISGFFIYKTISICFFLNLLKFLECLLLFDLLDGSVFSTISF